MSEHRQLPNISFHLGRFGELCLSNHSPHVPKFFASSCTLDIVSLSTTEVAS